MTQDMYIRYIQNISLSQAFPPDDTWAAPESSFHQGPEKHEEEPS